MPAVGTLIDTGPIVASLNARDPDHEACKAAFRQTGDRKYLRFMREAYDWFLGVNDLGVPLYDFRTGGCHDGLTPEGPNENEGAESTLACLLALLTLTEIYSEQDRVVGRRRR